MGFFTSDTYSKSYLFGLGQRWGINAEAGHLIEKGEKRYLSTGS